MKIYSWNTNGIRATYKQGYWRWFQETQPDILCVQETKAEPSQLPQELIDVPGYYTYFSWSKVKAGYSGVAIYTKVKPERVEYGLGIPEFDDEGRTIIVFYRDFVLLNVYFPNGGGGPHRLDYKLRFYDAFLEYIDDLKKQGQQIIFCGDVNTAHEEIDLARPKENEEHTGFLPEERAWIDEVIAHGYVDIYRHANPHKTGAYTYWDIKSAARERNVGWRIDYFFVAREVLPRVKDNGILPDVYGSDHCPIYLELNP